MRMPLFILIFLLASHVAAAVDKNAQPAPQSSAPVQATAPAPAVQQVDQQAEQKKLENADKAENAGNTPSDETATAAVDNPETKGRK